MSGLRAKSVPQPLQHRQVGVAGRGGEAVIGQVGDGDEADVPVLAIERAAGQWLVDILEPVGADEVRVVGDRAQIAGIGGAAFVFGADPDQPFPKEPAIGRAEMKFADQRGLAERMKARPLVIPGKGAAVTSKARPGTMDAAREVVTCLASVASFTAARKSGSRIVSTTGACRRVRCGARRSMRSLYGAPSRIGPDAHGVTGQLSGKPPFAGSGTVSWGRLPASRQARSLPHQTARVLPIDRVC